MRTLCCPFSMSIELKYTLIVSIVVYVMVSFKVLSFTRLSTEKDVTPDDSVPHLEHETMREQLEGEVNHLTQLLQGALRKQDEMALEAADAWQKVRRKKIPGVRIKCNVYIGRMHPSSFMSLKPMYSFKMTNMVVGQPLP